MRVSERKLNISLKKQIEKTLVRAILDFKNFDELYTFLSDFFNEGELETFAKRLSVAYWLKKKRSYTNIRENLKVSSATIATVEKLMKKPGFVLVLKKIEAEEWATQWADKIRKFVRK